MASLPALLLQSEHLRLRLGKGRVQDLDVGALLLERLLLRRHLHVLPLLGPHHHLVLYRAYLHLVLSTKRNYTVQSYVEAKRLTKEKLSLDKQMKKS